MGGSNGHESVARYQRWLAHPGDRFKSTMQECMARCVANDIPVIGHV